MTDAEILKLIALGEELPCPANRKSCILKDGSISEEPEEFSYNSTHGHTDLDGLINCVAIHLRREMLGTYMGIISRGEEWMMDKDLLSFIEDVNKGKLNYIPVFVKGVMAADLHLCDDQIHFARRRASRRLLICDTVVKYRGLAKAKDIAVESNL